MANISLFLYPPANENVLEEEEDLLRVVSSRVNELLGLARLPWMRVVRTTCIIISQPANCQAEIHAANMASTTSLFPIC